MPWPWKKPPSPETDLPEALELLDDARDQRNRAVAQGFAVSQITTYLNERRALNHFGDSIQISFTRRNRA